MIRRFSMVRKNAGKLLQRSLDNVLGTDLRISRKGKKEYDGIIGSNTRAAIAQAAHQNKLRAVNNEMAKQRERVMRQLPNFKANPGWVNASQIIPDAVTVSAICS